MDKAVIVQFAKSKGYYDVIYNGKWRSYDVYEPVFQGNEVHYVGPPLTILVKGDEIRMSTVKEAFEILDEMETEEERR